MSKSAPAEALLALFAGRERAAAILGDLTEMAATRGRLWFWTSYARTLVFLSWRPPVAFLTGVGVSAAILYAEMPTWIGHIFLFIGHPHIWPPLDQVRSELWFVVPFAAVRYGFRDRVVQLALALLMATSLPFYLGFWFDFDPIPVTCIVSGLLVTACLAISSPWRAAFIPLAGISALGFAVSECQNHIQWVADLDYRDPACWVLVLVYMLTVSIAFSWLHSSIDRRPQHSHPVGVAHD